MQRETYRRKIFIKHISNKELVSRIYKELSMLHNNKTIRKQRKDMKKHWTEDIEMANKHMKMCSTVLDVREIKLKLQWDITTYLWIGWMDKIKKIVTAENAGEYVKKFDHSCITGGNIKWWSHSRTWCDNFLRS